MLSRRFDEGVTVRQRARYYAARAFNALPLGIRAALYPSKLLVGSAWSQKGAFALTNKQFASWEAAWLPAAHNELADQTGTTGTQNTGVVGLKWARVRISVKTFGTLTAADTFRATLQVGTGASITNPENIAQANVTVETGDTSLQIVMIGASQNGFQSYKIIITTASSHSFTADIMVDAA